MAGHPRLTPEQCAAILADARETVGTSLGSTRMIAARNGVSEASVRRVVSNAPGMPQFGTPETRARMQNAIEQTKLSLSDRRARLSEILLNKAAALVAMTDSDQYRVYNFGGKDNTYNEKILNGVPVKDQQVLLTAAAIALDKHRMLDQYDSDAARGNAVDQWLEFMMPKPERAAEDG